MDTNQVAILVVAVLIIGAIFGGMCVRFYYQDR